MRLPPGYTEREVLDVIEKVASKFSVGFAFGCHDKDDIGQEARLHALRFIESGRFDPTRGQLEHVLTKHVRLRLLNMKRDQYRRTDCPCKSCQEGRPCGRAPDGQLCHVFIEWKRRNDAKASAACPKGLPDEANLLANTDDDAFESAELRRLIDEELDMDLRVAYLRMCAGEKVSIKERDRIRQAVSEILANRDDILV